MPARFKQVVLWGTFVLILAALFLQSGFIIEDLTGAIFSVFWSLLELALSFFFLVSQIRTKSALWITVTAITLVMVVGVCFCSSLEKIHYWSLQPKPKNLTEQEKIDRLKAKVNDLQNLSHKRAQSNDK